LTSVESAGDVAERLGSCMSSVIQHTNAAGSESPRCHDASPITIAERPILKM